MTELIVYSTHLLQEPAGRIEVAEKLAIESSLKQLITQSKRLEGIALCGTLPPGLTGGIYSFICQLKPAECVLLIDAYQNTEW